MDTQFVAFAYGGWHSSAWRGGANEWDLLDEFRPLFDGQTPPAAPLEGRYDDTLPETAASQAQVASANGLHAFSYFLYYGPDGFVMQEPLEAALAAAPAHGLSIGTTWCLRLPHHVFPILLETDQLGFAPPLRVHDDTTEPIRVGDLYDAAPSEVVDALPLSSAALLASDPSATFR